MDQNILANGKIIKEMALAPNIMQMENNMLDVGQKIKSKEKEN